MGKHDTILKNLFAVTRSRSRAVAMRGWEVADKINLSVEDEQAACELCGTRFRRGAVVVRPVPRAKKPVVLTVGGDCLVTLLEHEFGKPKALANRRAATTERINKQYAGLADAGSWAVWVYEHAPPELAGAAVRLRHLGVVRSDAELKRLIAFHDAKRKYSTEAVLPITGDLRTCGIRVPASITLDQARRLLAGLSEAKMGRVLSRLGERYLADSRSSSIDCWDYAWRGSNALERRLVAALAWLSESLQSEGPEVWRDWLARRVRMPALKFPALAPSFTWNKAYGLCLMTEDAPSPEATVDVFLWGRNEWTRFRASALRPVIAKDGKDVLPLEREAFLSELPSWCADVV